MKAEMRDVLAQQSFEEKIRKVGELIRLTRNVKAHGVSPDPQGSPQSAFRNPQSIGLPPKNSKE
jgi:hypothetical protein